MRAACDCDVRVGSQHRLREGLESALGALPPRRRLPTKIVVLQALLFRERGEKPWQRECYRAPFVVSVDRAALWPRQYSRGRVSC